MTGHEQVNAIFTKLLKEIMSDQAVHQMPALTFQQKKSVVTAYQEVLSVVQLLEAGPMEPVITTEQKKERKRNGKHTVSE